MAVVAPLKRLSEALVHQIIFMYTRSSSLLVHHIIIKAFLCYITDSDIVSVSSVKMVL